MDRNEVIRIAQDRVVEKLKTRPEKRYSTSVTQARIEDGLVCTATQDGHVAVMDLGKPMGGRGVDPSPSFYARAAVAGCVAICIKMTALREGFSMRNIDVEVETDHDNLAILVPGLQAAPLETRIRITIDSEAPRRRLGELVDRALGMDIWYLALRDAQNVKTSVRYAAKDGHGTPRAVSPSQPSAEQRPARS